MKCHKTSLYTVFLLGIGNLFLRIGILFLRIGILFLRIGHKSRMTHHTSEVIHTHYARSEAELRERVEAYDPTANNQTDESLAATVVPPLPVDALPQPKHPRASSTRGERTTCNTQTLQSAQ